MSHPSLLSTSSIAVKPASLVPGVFTKITSGLASITASGVTVIHELSFPNIFFAPTVSISSFKNVPFPNVYTDQKNLADLCYFFYFFFH